MKTCWGEDHGVWGGLSCLLQIPSRASEALRASSLSSDRVQTFYLVSDLTPSSVQDFCFDWTAMSMSHWSISLRSRSGFELENFLFIRFRFFIFMLSNKLFTLILLDKIDIAKVSLTSDICIYFLFLQMIIKYRYAVLIIYVFISPTPDIGSLHLSSFPVLQLHGLTS